MQQSFVPSEDSYSNAVFDDCQAFSHLGSDTTACAPPFIPKPPSRDKERLLRRTYSNPEDAESRRLPSLRIAKTMKMPGLAAASRVIDPLPRQYDFSSRLRLTKNPVKASDPQNQNSKHKKLERSQTAPVALLKPIMKTNPEDFRGRVMACSSPVSEKTLRQNVFTCRKISEEGDSVSCDQVRGEQRISSPVMKVLPNGRKIVSRTNQQRSAVANIAKQSTSIQTIPSDNDKPCNEREICKDEVAEHKACERFQGKRDVDTELTYLTFAKERQEENNRI